MGTAKKLIFLPGYKKGPYFQKSAMMSYVNQYFSKLLLYQISGMGNQLLLYRHLSKVDILEAKVCIYNKTLLKKHPLVDDKFPKYSLILILQNDFSKNRTALRSIGGALIGI